MAPPNQAKLRDGAVTTVIGIASGLALAAARSRLVVSPLVSVSAHDAATFIAVPVILAFVALAASALPAAAAIRIEPTEALRLE
ncbi:MAG TPA: hypothetical protein VF159_01555 [Gemmatimonadaceae bacterium]